MRKFDGKALIRLFTLYIGVVCLILGLALPLMGIRVPSIIPRFGQRLEVVNPYKMLSYLWVTVNVDFTDGSPVAEAEITFQEKDLEKIWYHVELTDEQGSCTYQVSTYYDDRDLTRTCINKVAVRWNPSNYYEEFYIAGEAESSITLNVDNVPKSAALDFDIDIERYLNVLTIPGLLLIVVSIVLRKKW